MNGGSALAFEQVSFSYPSRPQHASLRDVSLQVQPGETVAVVGPSGAGKSTLFHLLLRFYDVSSGAVRLDGVPVRELKLADLRGRIGIVPQDSTVFSTSAMENIRYGRPDAQRRRGDRRGARGLRARLHQRAARRLRELPRRTRRAACQAASDSASRSHARC